ncbi:MAG: CAP domain-containing protein [Massilia sp.]
MPALAYPLSPRLLCALLPLLFITTCTEAAPRAARARSVDYEAQQLASHINDYRADPPDCQGGEATPAQPLSLQSALFDVHLQRGLLLESAMKNAGYRAEYANAVSVTGARDARAAMQAIERPYCALLTSARFSDIGVLHVGDDWVVLLAAPYRAPVLADWPKAGKSILAAVNAARARPRACGERQFGAAPPVTWNEVLGQAALGHSRDMAERRYFDHHEADGSDAGERALRLGYRWSRIGENIASGLGSPEEAVAGWIASPGHCANLMNPNYTQMGAAYAVNRASENHTLYWTQVFATPR